MNKQQTRVELETTKCLSKIEIIRGRLLQKYIYDPVRLKKVRNLLINIEERV